MTDRMTVAQLREHQKAKGGTKRVQGAERFTMDGYTFPSKREANRYRSLRLMQLGGEIHSLEMQVGIDLIGRDGPILTPSGRPMRYVADFRYFDIVLQEWIYEDAKGHTTEVFKIKKAILAAQGIHIKEV